MGRRCPRGSAARRADRARRVSMPLCWPLSLGCSPRCWAGSLRSCSKIPSPPRSPVPKGPPRLRSAALHVGSWRLTPSPGRPRGGCKSVEAVWVRHRAFPTSCTPHGLGAARDTQTRRPVRSPKRQTEAAESCVCFGPDVEAAGGGCPTDRGPPQLLSWPAASASACWRLRDPEVGAGHAGARSAQGAGAGGLQQDVRLAWGP